MTLEILLMVKFYFTAFWEFLKFKIVNVQQTYGQSRIERKNMNIPRLNFEYRKVFATQHNIALLRFH